jgi:peptidoglycan/xylan/chitin deacetylase (PgdA/CDA1 family)
METVTQENNKHLLREGIGMALLAGSSIFSGKQEGILSVYFHKPSRKLFVRIIETLRREGYHFISVGDLENRFREGRPSGKEALITFDDGCLENLELIAYLNQSTIPICLFIPVDPVISGNYWWDYASQKGQEKISGISSVEAFKKLPVEVFDKKIDELKNHFSLDRTCMTLETLKELSKNPLITIGAHTVTHPILHNCPYDRQKTEIVESRRIIAEWIQKPVTDLAFPNGDFNEETIELTRLAGYRFCFTTKPGRIDYKTTDLHRLNRYAVNDLGGYYENMSKVKGAWQSIFPVK